jgi:CRISPR-associated protein Csh1
MQDKAFVQIGKLVLKEMGNKEPYQLFIQNMFPEKPNYKMIVAVFKLETSGDRLVCSFKNIDPQNVSIQNFQKYAYRKGSARGGDITFTTKFGDIEKKFRTLVEQQLKGSVTRLSSSAPSVDFHVFNATYKFLQQKNNYEQVKRELSVFYEGLPKEDKTSSGLSLMFIVDGEERYLSDFEIIQQMLTASGTEEKSEKYGVKSEGLDNVCSICLQKQAKVHGFASPFKYATVDKPGMVSGFFKQSNNWKNYPVCTDCSLEFELGRTYIANNLSSYFYGKAYYMIPKTILSKDTKNLGKALTRLRELYSNLSRDGQKVQHREDSLQKMIAGEDDYFNLNLLFYEENPTTKAIKIKLMLEEIVPSRFRKLFVDAPNKINSQKLYKGAITIKKEKHDLLFSFGTLKTFFEDDFYGLIQKVFMLQRISSQALYTKIMTVVRENYNRMQTSDGYVEMTNLTIRKAHLTISYFQELGLIDHNLNYILMDAIEQPEKKSAFDVEKLKRFVDENKGFLDSDYKVGIFSVGILVRLLLNIQQVNLGNTPFEKKLKGYSLSSDLLKNVYMEALSKISQYQSFYAYSNLREFIDHYFILNIHKVNKISNNELSFYFVSGLEFGNQFKNTEVSEELQNSSLQTVSSI